MSRRAIAAVIAVVLAIAGTVLVVGYVTRADERALAGMKPVAVLVMTDAAPEGTPAEELAVATEDVPADAVVPGALADLTEVAGMVTTAELNPGEQVLASRFSTLEELMKEKTEADVPAGMHELTIELEPRRVVGGRIAPGDTVGVFVSLSTDPAETHLTLHKVLVTRVDGGRAVVANEDGEPAEQAPASAITVGLALHPADAEKVVYASEFGTIWLSREPEDAPEDQDRIVTEENVFS